MDPHVLGMMRKLGSTQAGSGMIRGFGGLIIFAGCEHRKLMDMV